MLHNCLIARHMIYLHIKLELVLDEPMWQNEVSHGNAGPLCHCWTGSKYFWCNVVHNQLGTNPPKKELLKMCLNLLDVSGLQIGQQLSGCTLVQYAGSLTGQDFDIITQISPYVFYNLVPWVCLDA
jgi:hypothetical protein